LGKKEIKENLIFCFKKCGSERKRLRNCVIDVMDFGLTKKDVLNIADEITSDKNKDEIYLCAVTAIGQAFSYEDKQKKSKNIILNQEEIDFKKDKLKKCFKKCGLARSKLRKCVINALNFGLTKEEVLALTDDIVGNFGKDEVSVCAIIAVEQVLMHKEIDKLKNMVRKYAPYMQFSDENVELEK